MEQMPPAAPEPEVPESSLAAKLVNVFAVPGEVFEEIRNRAVQHWNWVTPALLAVFVGWIGSMLIFAQPAINQQLRDISSEAIEKQIEKGKIPAEQAEQMRQAAEKYGAIGQKVSAYAAPVLGAFISPFFWGLILWLFGNKVLRGTFGFMKAVEAAGLANMIGVLEGIVRTLLIIAMGNIFAAPGLMLLVRDFDPQNPVHSLAAAVNVMTFWLLGIRSLALARLSGATFGKAACCIFGVWAGYTLFFWGLAAGIRAILPQ